MSRPHKGEKYLANRIRSAKHIRIQYYTGMDLGFHSLKNDPF